MLNKMKYLIMDWACMRIIYWHMCKTIKKVRKALRRCVRKSSVHIMHLHLSIPIHLELLDYDSNLGHRSWEKKKEDEHQMMPSMRTPTKC